ncbi:MAG: hypothetical protein IKE70_01615 [Bacilli bacterium]|nr:hypothetical protein [Bacilli bacterium]
MKVNNKTKKKIKKNICDKNKNSYLFHLSYGDCVFLIKNVLGGLEDE